MLAVYTELERWDALPSVVDGLARIEEPPAARLESLSAMAKVVEKRLGDGTRAAQLWDEVLDLDKKRLDAFEEIVRLYTASKDWKALDRAYRKMIARIKDDDEPKLKFVLFHQLGLIYRDRLGDAPRAFEALEAASRIDPDHAEVRKILTELLVVTDNLDAAVARVRSAIGRDPHDAELYQELYELFLRQHAFDRAWCALSVLACLRELSPEQARFFSDYAPMPLSEIPGQLVEDAWHSHVLHADLDPTLTRLFGLVTPAIARFRASQLRPEQRIAAPFTPAHSRLHEAVRTAFSDASEILCTAAPELLLGEPGSEGPFAPAIAPLGAIFVSPSRLEEREESLVYLIGKRLAERRPELMGRAFFPSVAELTAVLASAVRVSRSDGTKDAAPKDPAAAALDAGLQTMLTPGEREELRSIVTRAHTDGRLLDVKRWFRAADLSSSRAGLLLGGDLDVARRATLAEPQLPSDLSAQEKIAELYVFATSDLYADLRGAIGVTVQG